MERFGHSGRNGTELTTLLKREGKGKLAGTLSFLSPVYFGSSCCLVFFVDDHLD
jgi:hypothetical protein